MSKIFKVYAYQGNITQANISAQFNKIEILKDGHYFYLNDALVLFLPFNITFYID